MQALLVVDVDHGDGWRPNNINTGKDRQQVAEEIKRVLEEKRAKSEIIVFIVFAISKKVTGQEAHIEYKSENCIVCDGLSESERLAPFLEHRHKAPFEAAFIKIECNAFSNQQLAPYLYSLGVDEVVLVGCMTFACILDTAIGALKAGFNVSLLQKCTYPSFSDIYIYSSRERWLELATKTSEQLKLTAKII